MYDLFNLTRCDFVHCCVCNMDTKQQITLWEDAEFGVLWTDSKKWLTSPISHVTYVIGIPDLISSVALYLF